MTWKEGFIEIARDRQVTGEMFRVLFVILGSLEGTNSTNMTQAEIARVLGINKERVYRAITRLIAKGIIVKKIEGGKIVGYQVSDYFGYFTD